MNNIQLSEPFSHFGYEKNFFFFFWLNLKYTRSFARRLAVFYNMIQVWLFRAELEIEV